MSNIVFCFGASALLFFCLVLVTYSAFRPSQPVTHSLTHSLIHFTLHRTNAPQTAVGKHRAGTGEFQAPFGIAYEGVYYATKEEADASRGTHIESKRLALGLTTATNMTATASVATSPEDGDGGGEEKKDLGVFRLGVLCIPTKPGWSRAIILAGGQAKPKTQNNPETAPAVTKPKPKTKKLKKKKKKTSIVMKIFGIIPPWVVHLLSNRFLDSDLAFLHFQEQERLRHDTSGSANKYYYMPAEADRCVTALRRWIPRHTDYLSVEGSDLPPPLEDRAVLFDRYRQHTSHCQHCRKGLEFLTTTVRKSAWAGLVGSVLASHWLHRHRWWGLSAKLAALACAGILRAVASLEPAFRVGGFDHAENH